MDFKLSNSYTAYYARYFVYKYPERASMFTLKKLKSTSLKEEWWKFHKANPHIMQMFEDQVFRAIQAGRNKVSSKQIFEWLRWEVQFTTTTSQYK